MLYSTVQIDGVNYKIFEDCYMIYTPNRHVIMPLDDVIKLSKSNKALFSRSLECRRGKNIFFKKKDPINNHFAIKSFNKPNDAKIFFDGKNDISDSFIDTDIVNINEPIFYTKNGMAFYEVLKFSLVDIASYFVYRKKNKCNKFLTFLGMKLMKDIIDLHPILIEKFYNYEPGNIYHFKKLIMMDSLINVKTGINMQYFIYNDIITKLKVNRNLKLINDKIFIIRKNGISKRNLINKNQIIDIAHKYGFKTFSPEIDCNNFEEQASIMANCKYLICEVGSGACNSLFMKQNSKVLFLTYNLRGVRVIEKTIRCWISNTCKHDMFSAFGELTEPGMLSWCRWKLNPDIFETELIKMLN